MLPRSVVEASFEPGNVSRVPASRFERRAAPQVYDVPPPLAPLARAPAPRFFAAPRPGAAEPPRPRDDASARLARLALLAPAPPPPPRAAPREPSLPPLLPSPRDGSEPTTESPRSELAPPRLDDRIPSDEGRLLNRTFSDVGSDTWDVDDGPGEPAAAAAAPADPDDAVPALFDEIFAPSAVFIDR